MSKQIIVNLLQSGVTIEKYKESGDSMLPIISSGQPVKLEPILDRELKVNDIVFCKVKGNYYTHKITKIRGKQYQISNNKSHVNGWITRNGIFGIVIEIYD